MLAASAGRQASGGDGTPPGVRGLSPLRAAGRVLLGLSAPGNLLARVRPRTSAATGAGRRAPAPANSRRRHDSKPVRRTVGVYTHRRERAPPPRGARVARAVRTGRAVGLLIPRGCPRSCLISDSVIKTTRPTSSRSERQNGSRVAACTELTSVSGLVGFGSVMIRANYADAAAAGTASSIHHVQNSRRLAGSEPSPHGSSPA
jgi:hypothetical protein